MPVVQMADGTMVDVPDNPSPELIQRIQSANETLKASAVKSAEASPAAAPSAVPDMGHYLDLARDSAVRGAAALPAMMAQAGGIMNPPVLSMRDNKAAQEQWKNANPPQELADWGTQPKDTAGKYIRSAVEGGTGAAAFPLGPGSLLKQGLVGLSSGIMSEAAGQASGDNPIARFAGGLAGGLPFAAKDYLSRPPKQLVEALVDFPQAGVKDIPVDSPSHPLSLIQRNMQRGAALEDPVKLTAAQAYPHPSNLDAVQEVLARSQYGKETSRLYHQQPSDMQMAASNLVDNMPGQTLSRRDAANAAQDAATSALQQVRQRARQAFGQALDPMETFSQQQMQTLDSRLREFADSRPNTAAAELANYVREKLLDPKAVRTQEQMAGSSLLGPTGRPLAQEAAAQQPKFLTMPLQVRDAAEDALKSGGPAGLNANRDARQLKEATAQIRGILDQSYDEAGGSITRAKQAMAEIMAGEYDPMRQGPLGQVAGKGYRGDTAANAQVAFRILDEGVNPQATVSPVSTMLEGMAKAGKKDEAVNLVKSWMADKLNGINNKPVPGGRVADNMGEQLMQAFGDWTKNDARQQGLRDAIAFAAKASGEDPTSMVRGFENFMKTVTYAAKRPAQNINLAAGEVEKLTGTSTLKLVNQINGITPLRVPSRLYARHKEKVSLQLADQLLTSPEGIEKLKQLSKMNPLSPAAQDLASSIVGTALASDSEITQGN